MKNKINHLLSGVVLILFLILASGSFQLPDEPECGDPQNIMRAPIEESSQISTFFVRAIDQETGEPIPGLKVTYSTYLCWVQGQYSGNDCPDEGKMNLFPVDENVVKITNQSGYIEDVAVWIASDEQDAMIGQIFIEDENSVYESGYIMIRLGVDDPSSTFTIPLLKSNSL